MFCPVTSLFRMFKDRARYLLQAAVSLYVFDVGDESLSLNLTQDIYDGTYRSQRVCLKVLRVFTSDDPVQAAKVCYP